MRKKVPSSPPKMAIPEAGGRVFTSNTSHAAGLRTTLEKQLVEVGCWTQ